MELNISKVVSLLLVRLKYILLVALIFALLIFGFTKVFIQEKYSSSAKILVVMDADYSKTSEASFVKEAIHSYLAIFETTKFFNEVSEVYAAQGHSGELFTATQLMLMTDIESSANVDEPSFTVEVTSSNPDTCYDVAETVANYMITKSAEYPALNKIKIIDDPIKPLVPVSPNIMANTLVGFFIGAVCCAAFFICKEMFDNKIKNLEDITSMHDIPILGVVPDTTPAAEKRARKGRED